MEGRKNKKRHRFRCRFGGGLWIRTTVGGRQQIYSLPPLATWVILPMKLCLGNGHPARWSWWTDSNPRPADYKSAALPTELHQRVCPTGRLLDSACSSYQTGRPMSRAFLHFFGHFFFSTLWERRQCHGLPTPPSGCPADPARLRLLPLWGRIV